jgi:hypothetical protein
MVKSIGNGSGIGPMRMKIDTLGLYGMILAMRNGKKYRVNGKKYRVNGKKYRVNGKKYRVNGKKYRGSGTRKFFLLVGKYLKGI